MRKKGRKGSQDYSTKGRLNYRKEDTTNEERRVDRKIGTQGRKKGRKEKWKVSDLARKRGSKEGKGERKVG